MARRFTLRKLKNFFLHKNGRVFLIVLCSVIALLTFISFLILHKKDKLIINPKDTIGNTAGNLNNSGLFCEYNDTIYFSNPFDDGALYTMTPDEKNIKLLNTAVVQNLLAGGDYIYFFQSNVSGSGDISNIASKHGFRRATTDCQHIYNLVDDVVVTGQLINDYLYLVTVKNTGIEFIKLRCDKTEQVSLAGYVINPAAVYDNNIYYNSTKDNHHLFVLNTANDIPSQVLSTPMYYPVVEDGYVYFMDISHNYRLCRYGLGTGVSEVLTSDRVDCFNVGSGYIYYQKNGTDPALKCMRTDGTDSFIVAEGNYTHINMTSHNVYFQEYESKILYHGPIGSTSCSVFTEAQSAVKSR